MGNGGGVSGGRGGTYKYTNNNINMDFDSLSPSALAPSPNQAIPPTLLDSLKIVLPQILSTTAASYANGMICLTWRKECSQCVS
jgi:hypothetical protein